MKPEKIDSIGSFLQSQILQLKNIIQVKDIGLDIGKLEPHFKGLMKEISKQVKDLVAEAKKPKEPRTLEEILDALSNGEKVTPELVEEAKKALKLEKKKGKE